MARREKSDSGISSIQNFDNWIRSPWLRLCKQTQVLATHQKKISMNDSEYANRKKRNESRQLLPRLSEN